MKQCPVCNNTYTDDNDFCPEDGTRLTGGVSGGYSSSDLPTETFRTPTPYLAPPPPAPSGPGSWIYVLLGALGAIVIVGGIYIFSSGGKGEEANNGFTSAGKPAATASPSPAPPIVNSNAVPANPNRESVAPPPVSSSPAGSWSGDWSSPSGAYLTINVMLDDDGSGGVSGRIEWTLRRTTRPDKQSKVGMSATEFVRGKYDPSSRALTLAGYRKDDPNNVLVMVDSYRLTLGGDSRSLNGKARNGGSWNATVRLSK